MVGVLRRLQERIERSCEALGLSYPWWIPAYSTMATIVITTVAFVQRGSAMSSPAVIAALILTLVPTVVWISSAWLLPPWIEAGFTSLAVVLYLTAHQVKPDFAPLLYMIVAGEVAATLGMFRALIVASVDIAVLAVLADAGRVQNLALYIVLVVLGTDVGIALRWQMRALAAERANVGIAREQAMLAERQRIAREVHDVVGHSLSINLLHVTAARHALQQHGDVPDAIESLVEAERVGRTAMGDLRRTVSTLSTGPSEKQALPGIGDIPALVEQCRAAGLDVRYEHTGEYAGFGDATCLGVYRIVQECLANIAKHAPTSAAVVTLTVQPDRLQLSVRNSLPFGRPQLRGGGSGLPGMAARAGQIGAELRAGVEGDEWLVDLVVPNQAPVMST